MRMLSHRTTCSHGCKQYSSHRFGPGILPAHKQYTVKGLQRRHNTDLIRAASENALALIKRLSGCTSSLTDTDVEHLLQQNPELCSKDREDYLEVVQHNAAFISSQKLDPQKVFMKAPRLLVTRLAEWAEFLEGYGFSAAQVKQILVTAPHELAAATLVSAGQTMVNLKAAGLDEYGVIQMCVYYPQVMRMDTKELASLLSVLAKHQATHGAI